ncbi:MAG: aryl carrier-like protein, partial [Saprospiraceae bacterium]
LTPNGKVDRKALPEPDVSHQQNDYLAPRTEIEKNLCDIWQEVLGVDRVGTNDNLFHLGGHSLLIITLVSKMKAGGYEVLPREVFESPTVGLLGALLESQKFEKLVDFEYTNGDLIYSLPFKQLLYKTNFKDDWLGAQYLTISQASPNEMEKALRLLLTKHSALRHSYYLDDSGKVVEKDNALGYDAILVREDFSCYGEMDEIVLKIIEYTKAVFSEINLKANLYKFVLFDCGEGRDSIFLTVIHHANTDRVSAGVIFSDLFRNYLTLVSGKDLTDTHESTSLEEWGYRYYQYMNSPEITEDCKYWMSLPWKDIGTLVDFPDGVAKNVSGVPRVYDDVLMSFSLPDKVNRFLSNEKDIPCGVSVSDIIFFGFVSAVSSLSGNPCVRFDLQSSGRESFVRGVDISRTVGLFLQHVPVLVEAKCDDGKLNNLLAFVEAYRNISNRGLSFEGLKHFSEDSSIRKSFSEIPRAEFAVNFLPSYLDVEQKTSDPDLPWDLVVENRDDLVLPDIDRPQTEGLCPSYIEISFDEGYTIRWGFRDNVYKKQTIEKAASVWIQEISDVVDQLESLACCEVAEA